MSRSRLIAILFSTLCLGLAAPADAKIPDPAHSDVPDLITLVGCGANGTADPFGTFAIVVRDYAGTAHGNQQVILDFHACPDIRVCADQGDPNVLVDCPSQTVRTLTDPDGRATFRVIGCAANTGASPGSIGPSLAVYADGVLLKVVRVAALDQDGSGGVSAGDLSMFLSDYFSGQSFARSDYDGDGALGARDLSRWLSAYFAAGSPMSGVAACP